MFQNIAILKTYRHNSLLKCFFEEIGEKVYTSLRNPKMDPFLAVWAVISMISLLPFTPTKQV